MPDETSPNQIPPGFTLRHTLHDVLWKRRHGTERVAWSPDGLTLASCGGDSTVRLWDATTGQQRRKIDVSSYREISGVAWSPDGRLIASGGRDYEIKLWNAGTGQLHRTIECSEHIKCLAWSPDGRLIASGGRAGVLRLWDAETGQPHRELARSGYYLGIEALAWSPDGRLIASGSDDIDPVGVWDVETGELRWEIERDSSLTTITALAWSPDGKLFAYGDEDGLIFLLDGETGRQIISLEGHTGYINDVSFSHDGRLLASTAGDYAVRLWRCDTWATVAKLGTTISYGNFGLAFHPRSHALATFGEEDTVIRIWDLDLDVLLNVTPAKKSVRYTNAKVVLVGESGVGKTGLGYRLAKGVWQPTSGSTHGMNVWSLSKSDSAMNAPGLISRIFRGPRTPPAVETEREVMLWDFAGQDEYRLVHQLFLNETNVALVLYDPTKSNDTFEGVEFWEKALKNVVQGEVRKILVAARVDVGGVRMTEDVIKAYCQEHGYVVHLATSAETGQGFEELRAAIMRAIPWEQLPRTSSPEVFKRVKDFLAAVRQGNRVLVREHDLMAEFNARGGREEATEAEFGTVIGHVETAGLIKRLSFGDLVLLKPELLNGYASDIIDAARRHTDGLGAVSKSDVLEGRVSIREEGGLKSADKIFLLHATVELFLRLGLALEQNANLVFPSKFNRRMPPLEQDPVVEVEFAFEGPVENLYTTLIVKLYYGGVFRLKQLWKNAAEFVNGRSQVCGFQLQNKGDGQGRLKVFYAEGVRDDDKALFLKIVADHFAEKRVEVRRERLYRCPECREAVRDRNAVHRALERGATEMPCLYCYKPFPLVDALEMLYRDDEKFLSQIAAMESKAEASMERGGDLVAASAEMKTEGFKQWAGGAGVATVAIVFTDVLGSTGLNVEMGDEPWRGVREAHFARARRLIAEGHGYFIKSIGDSVMAAFHSASDALDFALAFERDTGHRAVRIRAGIHVGPVEVTSADAFGQQVSMAARVEAKAEKGGIWTSSEVKAHVDTLRAARHAKLKWTEHRDETLKGFPNRSFVLWSVEE